MKGEVRSMKKTLSIVIILVITLSALVGCGPDRRQVSDILLKYAKPAAGAIVVEWTNITASEDPKLKEQFAKPVRNHKKQFVF